MDEIVTTVDIDAPPREVWEILTEFEAYEEWNPIMEITGTPTEGDRLDLVLTLPNRNPQPFRPKVLVADEPHEFRWLGRLFVSGLYDGEHRFVLESIDDGQRTRLTHGETFRGVLVGFINRRIGEDVRIGFEAMNEALKRRVENGTTLEDHEELDVEAGE